MRRVGCLTRIDPLGTLHEIEDFSSHDVVHSSGARKAVGRPNAGTEFPRQVFVPTTLVTPLAADTTAETEESLHGHAGL